MNKSELITRMAERLNGDRAAAAAAVNGVLDEIEGSVARGERVALSGFGTFDRRERASHPGRNPRTGEAIQVGPSVVAVFRPGTGFKSLLAAADGVAVTTASAVTGSSVPQAEDGKSAAAVADAPAGRVEAAARSGKKAGKEASEKAGKKATEKAGKKATEKAGKKATGKVGKKAAEKASTASGKKKPGKKRAAGDR
ncbi:HU family DNA-binding protein [Modestobacter excelsi]|uniref:HU family DNA-binding protein n=1 Tax=Modestobacter excelsi TaxID=2213161 RepID=UPI00110CC5A2|nr:HU family DNA-binding protein [Modestobacter excelsi]